MSGQLTSAEVEGLYRRYGFYLRRRCGLILRDTALVDDAMQEAFVRVYKHGTLVRSMERPLKWLARVVDRCAFDQLRRGKHSQMAQPIDGLTDTVGVHPAVSLELRDGVLTLLQSLDEKDRQIAMMAFVDGMTQAEIAAEMGYSRVTINKKVQSIRDRAERLLEARA